MPRKGPNKTREWRKQRRVVDANGEVRRVGRMFRNIRMSMPTTKAYPTELVILLMKHAGVPTPVFDAGLAAMRQREAELKAEKADAEVVDVEEVQPQGAA